MSATPYLDQIQNSQDELAIQYLPAVRSMAFRLKERLPSSVDFNDLVSVGTEELIKLSRRYDVALNDSFWGYAKTRVNGAMLDYLRSLDVVSRSSRKLIKNIDHEISKYYNEHGQEPDDVYLAEVLNEDIAKIRDAKAASDIYAHVPMDEQFNAIEQDNITKKLEFEELLSAIQATLKTMSDREQLLIQLYFFEELNLSEIREILGITESRISQIIKEVIKKVRKSLGESHG
ncbi:RNA polymerase sigma factor FliA [Helicobacter ailurogastricus]|uniref:RNA polymerase sigma factor for flagellar operon n=1 Tax=Helicobacter ailurogastricus TaxID=1578720 RepID=A0A0K2XAS2_9HELI|nr:RNA polymerase sigma factor FliA [Helicobacter ailurogastricus]CRF41677.1 RNA polymerase sigma factor for flagellar operon [Helicobacter ailurogastricus]CRF42668.1 RNA polymerase sigma factor for flagellar operon [Helicobacter ailurogastricus]CRF43834.1 RNA polymerase sigma factor for flagellar operon [Helicobacter ailurogastricus]CRF52680.1 RNA polymerase sigma factor for flagellar operon [Helicobacter ailurogastricus]BDQ29816.1 RNA polymerase sigma factor FliA [Helicobacter ailurogastricu